MQPIAVGLLDHLLVIGFALVVPAYDLSRTPAVRAAIARKVSGALLADYRRTIVILWTSTLLVLALRLASGSDLARLGLGAPGGWRFWTATGIASALAALLVLQPRRLLHDEKARAQIRERLASVSWFLPKRAAEYRMFLGLSVTAGICEELLYRGYLIGYLNNWMGPWFSVAVSSLLFGLAHTYLGVSHAVRAAVVGAFLAAVYIFAGALWPAMLLHAAIDVGNGRLAFGLVDRDPNIDHRRGSDR